MDMYKEGILNAEYFPCMEWSWEHLKYTCKLFYLMHRFAAALQYTLTGSFKDINKSTCNLGMEWVDGFF